ncbi:protein grainyhead-like [Condylostylus longicornis]|uniref:protein grainyhead-like n=1 Tax=Condylostylus longicornis TaxID=2530218 RepID=UPI00244E49A8|nr:protein grainyhead-like [Condylostylus longicornis]
MSSPQTQDLSISSIHSHSKSSSSPSLPSSVIDSATAVTTITSTSIVETVNNTTHVVVSHNSNSNSNHSLPYNTTTTTATTMLHKHQSSNSDSDEILTGTTTTSTSTSTNNVIHKTEDSPTSEMSTMTNVSVLDLQTQGASDASKLYDKNTVFIYGDQKVTELSAQDQVIDARLVAAAQNELVAAAVAQQQQQQQQPQLLTKIEMDGDIIRVIGPNGEQQQIISREIINGEHHILSRNEAGEHILTRIVSDPSKLLSPDVDGFETNHKLTPDPNVSMYQTSPLDASVYTQADPKDLIYEKETIDAKLESVYTTNDKQHQPIDLIYEDGNKTVIYTTSDQKALEMVYSQADLNNLVAEGQIVLQGNLPYSTSGHGGGQAVFIVADSLPPGVEGHLQRLVIVNDF